jgi:hypothetical protein
MAHCHAMLPKGWGKADVPEAGDRTGKNLVNETQTAKRICLGLYLKYSPAVRLGSKNYKTKQRANDKKLHHQKRKTSCENGPMRREVNQSQKQSRS